MPAPAAVLEALPLAALRLKARALVSASDPEPTTEPESAPAPPTMIEWAERHFHIPELNGPIVLAPYQKAVLAHVLTPGPDGLLPYSTVVWSDVKKSIKSCIAAAVVLWWASTRPWSSLKIIANDLKQADSRVMYYAKRAIQLNRGYFEGLGVKDKQYLIEFANGSRVEAIPIDPKGEAGGNDDVVCYSELWGWKQRAAQAMWTETTLSPTKFGKSLRWCETYAGFTGESPILEGLYEQGVKLGQPLPAVDLAAYAAGRLFVLWNTEPRLSWQTPEYYAQESATLLPNEFLRVHRNQWVSSTDQAIPAEWWAACADPHPLRVEKLPDGSVRGEPTPLVVGVDASVSGDCTAMVVASRHPTLHDHVCERYTKTWLPHDQPGGKMDYHATLSSEIKRLLAAGFNVVEVAYDPYQLHQWANDLRNQQTNLWLREFPQGTARLVADKGLIDLVRDRRLHHRGDVVLAQHVANCDAKTQADQDSQVRLVKRAESLKIDAAVALSMATAECLRLNI